jgi:hypothetical protein
MVKLGLPGTTNGLEASGTRSLAFGFLAFGFLGFGFLALGFWRLGCFYLCSKIFFEDQQEVYEVHFNGEGQVGATTVAPI